MSSAALLEKVPPALQNLRVALVHYWLVRRRGGEQVLEALADMFPQADIFTLVLDPASLGEALRHRRIYTSFLQRVPGIRRHYQKLLPLFPLALENFNLEGYDLVISSESGPAKGVITGSRTCHVCYCHTPMRYLWDMYADYRKNVPGGALGRAFYSIVSHYLRLWDQLSAERVDYFVANSHHVAGRIWNTYRRCAEVIYPPVAVEQYDSGGKSREFYLVASQLIRYKRIDLAIAACNNLGRKLVVIGEGDEFGRLSRMAGPTVTMLGWQPDQVLKDHYSRCRALLFPGEEDFGMTPVEAQASGRPVIAFGRGGALESVRGYFTGDSPCPDPTGVFFEESSVQSLSAAILDFESNEKQFSATKIQAHAQQFSYRRFRSEMSRFLLSRLEQFRLSQSEPQSRSLSNCKSGDPQDASGEYSQDFSKEWI
jgi:glycosyltransferase involved in cell wall biosynthesis